MIALIRLTPLRLALLAGLCLFAASCADIRVRPAPTPSFFDLARASRLDANDLSPRSMQTLRRLDLDALYRRSPDQALARLHAEAVQDPDPDFLFALAEGHFLSGRAAEGKERLSRG
jgi:hypothetical protein